MQSCGTGHSVVRAVPSDEFKHLQHKFTTLTREKCHKAMQPLSDPDKARLLALKQRNALLWLKVVPEHGLYKLTDFQVKCQLRLTLGLPPSDTDTVCRCGTTMDHAHPLVCISTRKLATETRHDCVLDALVKVARDLGVPVQREYRSWINGKAQRRLRPDLLFDGAGLSILSDVAITTPTTATAMKNGSTTTPLTAASLMETYKHNKYDQTRSRTAPQTRSIRT